MNVRHLAATAAIAFASSVSTSAHAHAKLEASSPKAGSTATPAPKEVRLQFNEPLEMTFSKIKLLNQQGDVIEPSKLVRDKAEPKAMIATLPALPTGSYRVQWTTVTRDGHKVKGEFPFQVK